MRYNIALQDEGLAAYMLKIDKIPILSELEEKDLIDLWVHHHDVKAAHRLVTSHLRLVVKIAFQFRNYGLSLMELVAEGTVGLMKAVKSFDPTVGCRVATYAMWWIKSSIQEYILKSWSLVKIGTTGAQRKLFFNLRKLQKRLLNNKEIAQELSVSESEVEEMHNTLSCHHHSLDQGTEDNVSHGIASLQEDSQETVYAEQQDLSRQKGLLLSALNTLDKRYREIITARKLREKPITLDKLSKKYNISRERVRQIEQQAMKKLKEFMTSSQESCL